MSAGNVLVYGGRGALGRTLVSFFKAKAFWVLSIDLVASDEADANVVVDPKASWTEQEQMLLSSVSSMNVGFDAILCVAGGWAGGSASNDDMIKNADLMWRQSVWSSALAARLASRCMKQGGLLQLTGARPCVGATPGMMGYGMAKAAVHQLTKSLANPEKAGLPIGVVTVAILPVTLDTPMNRKFMPDADMSTWTSMDYLAQLFFDWVQGIGRPASGSLVEIVTASGKTTLTPV
jgi:dihydropteridine reductase